VVVASGFTLVAVAVWAWAFEQRGRPVGDHRLLLWGILLVALGLTSGAVFEFGLRLRTTVNEVQPVWWRPAVRLAVAAACIGAALTCANFAIDTSSRTARGVILTVLAVVAGIPATAALFGIRLAVLETGKLASSENARRLQAYLDLRSLGLRLLTALGSLVALTTFALGASRREDAQGTEIPVPGEVVIAFGAVGTVLVGLLYAVPSHALREEARALVRALTPLAARDAAALRRELDERENLERQLGLTVSVMGELQAGIAVFGPLLAASIAALLPLTP
jgi:hypothetical protein